MIISQEDFELFIEEDVAILNGCNFIYRQNVPTNYRIARPLSEFDEEEKVQSFSLVSDKEYIINLFKMSCDCPDFSQSNREAYSQGDIRRMCKHLMRKYYAVTQGLGCTEFLAYVLKHAYAHPIDKLNFELTPLNRCLINYTYVPKDLKYEYFINGDYPVLITFNKYDVWWDVFVFKEEEYRKYGFSYEEDRWSYNEKPYGLVEQLRHKFLEIHKKTYPDSKKVKKGPEIDLINARNDFRNFQKEPQGCLVFFLLLLAVLTIIFWG